MKSLWWPKGEEDFLTGFPTEEQWQAELDSGWPGPNGSSASFDDVQGVRIGVTSSSFEYASLPANLHDFHYRVLRRLLWQYQRDLEIQEKRRKAGVSYSILPMSINSARWRTWRRSADMRHYTGLLLKTHDLIGISGRLAAIQCWTRYTILRLAGGRAARPNEAGEGYFLP